MAASSRMWECQNELSRLEIAALPGAWASQGLRATRRAGATVHEIMASTGHATLLEVQRYTRASRQKIRPNAPGSAWRDKTATKIPKPRNVLRKPLKNNLVTISYVGGGDPYGIEPVLPP